uniref:Uncharacterized protein n=1 Tax=Anguilla anguilla TaxID=7936 RepID=A0A0E9Q6H3_ANGAN
MRKASCLKTQETMNKDFICPHLPPAPKVDLKGLGGGL